MASSKHRADCTRWVWVVAAFSALCQLSESARAQASESAAHSVAITLVGAAGSAPGLGERIATWFDPQAFRVNVEARPVLDRALVLSPPESDVLFVWIVAENRDAARLFFSRRPRGSNDTVYLARTLALEDGLDEIGAERVAQVVHLSSVALLEGEQSTPRAEVEHHLAATPASSGAASPVAPAAPPVPPVTEAPPSPQARSTNAHEPVESSRPALHVGAGYGATHRFDEGLCHGPRATLELAPPWSVRPRLSVQGFLPIQRDLGPVDLELYGASASLIGSLETRLSPALALSGGVGLGIDLIRYEAKRSTSLPSLEPAEPRTEARPIAVAGASVTIGSAAPSVAIHAQAALALDDTHYDVTVDGENRVVARGPRIAPTLGVELWF